MNYIMIISPCISICKTDPKTGYCYGCGRNNEEKKIWKLENTTDVWKIKNLEDIKIHGIPRKVNEGSTFPFICIAPQCPEEGYWDRPEYVTSLINLLKEVEQKHRIDSDRIYGTGLSMGGYGTIALANERPDLFAAALPVCGGADFSDYSNLKSLPIWFFHGSEDDEHPASYSEKIYNALKDQNKDVKLTIYDGVGHNSWDLTYDNQEIYDWLLSKENSGENDKY